MEDDEERKTLFDVVYGRKSEKVVLQQLTMVAQVPSDAADRTELGARYENLLSQLTKQHKLDYKITGLLLIYPTCLLHIIETSEYMLDCFLNELQAMQEQPDCTLLGAKVAFMWHSLESRQFQQWSYKVLTANQIDENPLFTRLEKVEEGIETVVCRVLTPLQKLVTHLETSKDFPGAILDKKPEFLNPPEVLEQLLDRDELLSPQQYLQMYHSPLNISIDFGQVDLRSFF
ncbi:testis-expressed protein 47 isoform X2 [Gambusia affinis]|uniref:testis-expressed protein 47 isoform X2 n=1 Tax=Gambusia affinis TaxID=33528 RepID=UPI001CDD1A47|nr:testis-expressed protein 47 isoform X2 [Gambusia affinis]